MKRIPFIFLLLCSAGLIFAQDAPRLTDEQVRHTLAPFFEAFSQIGDLRSSLQFTEIENGYAYSDGGNTLSGSIHYVHDLDGKLASTTVVIFFDDFTVDGVVLRGKNIIVLSAVSQDMIGTIDGRLSISGADTDRFNWAQTRIMTHNKTFLPYEGRVYMAGGAYEIQRDWFE